MYLVPIINLFHTLKYKYFINHGLTTTPTKLGYWWDHDSWRVAWYDRRWSSLVRYGEEVSSGNRNLRESLDRRRSPFHTRLPRKQPRELDRSGLKMEGTWGRGAQTASLTAAKMRGLGLLLESHSMVKLQSEGGEDCMWICLLWQFCELKGKFDFLVHFV